MDWSTAEWRKSNGSDSGGCVEVAVLEGVVGVRDTKAAGAGPILEFTEHEWRVFTAGVKGREFDFDHLVETS